MSFNQDPWRPGAAVQSPVAAEPVREEPSREESDQPAETPQDVASPTVQPETPEAPNADADDELERALAEMRGEA